MNADDFLDRLRDGNETELSRLGSSKALYALTGGEMDRASVLEATANRAEAAATTFLVWVDEETDEEAQAAFQSTAQAEQDRAEAVADLLGEGFEPDDIEHPVFQYLLSLDDTVERVAAGLVGWAVTEEKTLAQTVGFFVGDANPKNADLFREFRADEQEQWARGIELLADRCESEADWERAYEAADGVIAAAYEEYVTVLEGMGVKPKPVC